MPLSPKKYEFHWRTSSAKMTNFKKKLTRLAPLMLALSLSQGVVAHPGGGAGHHHHEAAPITQAQAEAQAVVAIAKKVKQGKLADKWLSVSSSKTSQKSFGHGLEWVVEFVDPQPADLSKKTLYVFIGKTGKVLGVNFTGQ